MGFNSGFKGLNMLHSLMFVDPCIIVHIIKKKIQQDATMYQTFIIPYLFEARHVSGDTPPIIRSLKLHWQPLVFHMWKVVWTCSWWTFVRHIMRRSAAQYIVASC